MQTAVNNRCSGVLGNHCHRDCATHVIIIMHTYTQRYFYIQLSRLHRHPLHYLPLLLSWPSFTGLFTIDIHTKK